MRGAVTNQMRQQAVARWLDSARRAATIKDNRDQLLGRA
jgi:hypothetical protein